MSYEGQVIIVITAFAMSLLGSGMALAFLIGALLADML